VSLARRAKKIDSNQREIVKALRAIPGVTVQVDMSDILVGYKGKNYWIELKSPDNVSKKTGKVMDSAIKPSQVKLLKEWKGQYTICYNIDQILKEIGLIND